MRRAWLNGRAADSRSEGWGFNSLRPQFLSILTIKIFFIKQKRFLLTTFIVVSSFGERIFRSFCELFLI